MSGSLVCLVMGQGRGKEVNAKGSGTGDGGTRARPSARAGPATGGIGDCKSESLNDSQVCPPLLGAGR